VVEVSGNDLIEFIVKILDLKNTRYIYVQVIPLV